MPKRIAALREAMLRVSREMLLRDGYDGLTIRAVAKACGVAVGTVYNYFPSKDMLAASIMLEDWSAALVRMASCAAAAESALEGLRAVFETIRAFATRYAGAWAQYSARYNAEPVIRARHRQLIEQLEAVIRPLAERFGCLFHPSMPGFPAETLLSASINPDAEFQDLTPVLERLVSQ